MTVAVSVVVPLVIVVVPRVSKSKPLIVLVNCIVGCAVTVLDVIDRHEQAL